MKSAITEVAKIQQLARWKFPPAGEHLRNFDTAPTFSSYSPKLSALQDKPEEKKLGTVSKHSQVALACRENY
jgi:hypothetical protein